MTTTTRIAKFKDAVLSTYGSDTDFIFTRHEIHMLKSKDVIVPSTIWNDYKVPFNPNRKLPTPSRKCDMFDVSSLFNGGKAPAPVAPSTPAPVASAIATTIDVATTIADDLVPAINPIYVRFGNFHKIVKLIKSNRFFPTLVTGLSGNGKTLAIEQACAAAKREYIRVNITSESDADDLIGGFRLKDGDTVWHDGPVIEAMKRGSVLLLDEFDLGTDKTMCLQSIMEGKSYFIKKTGRMVDPAPGFQIFLTSNTKGQGDSTGRFIGARIINEAMLDRIKLTMEQGYPNESQERKIVTLAAQLENELTETDENFIGLLVKWVQAIRESYFKDEVESFISTRRAASIVESYFIFDRDKEFALETGISRFNTETKEAFMKFYEAIDENFRNEESEEINEMEFDLDHPF